MGEVILFSRTIYTRVIFSRNRAVSHLRACHIHWRACHHKTLFELFLPPCGYVKYASVAYMGAQFPGGCALKLRNMVQVYKHVAAEIMKSMLVQLLVERLQRARHVESPAVGHGQGTDVVFADNIQDFMHGDLNHSLPDVQDDVFV